MRLKVEVAHIFSCDGCQNIMRYRLAAALLNAFSTNDLSKSAYRFLGNAKNNLGGSTSHTPDAYIDRAKGFLELLRRHNVLHDGMECLEVGTGWIHWESMLVRNEIDGQTLLYDVWDNRSVKRFSKFAASLADPLIRQRIGFSENTKAALMSQVATSSSIEEAYRLLNFSYQVDSTGLLAGIADNSRDFIYSSGVAEHFAGNDAAAIIKRTYDILRPGGWAFHQIVLEDHLTIYAPSTHKKNYLQYSGRDFDRKFNNDVQYINRLQIPSWQSFFDEAEFKTISMERVVNCNLDEITVHEDYHDIPREDLACCVVEFLVQKDRA